MNKISERILCWSANLDDMTLKQALNIEQHPCLFGNVCLMPDTHAGYGMPIGGVVALFEAVSPNMVGVDIGCGMLAIKTSVQNIERDKLIKITEEIKKAVPVGFEHHKTRQENGIFSLDVWQETTICQREYVSAQKQIGTLGGGNHFIEIQKGDDGFIWFMIHTGSRNLGKKVADYYNKQAKTLCAKFHQDKVVKDEISFLPIGLQETSNYLKEMNLCLKFSYENRKNISKFIKEILVDNIANITFADDINIHHNYAKCEEHFGKKVWVHRKGATLADENTIGIIPGSQGTSSYIVQGLGNETSFKSCSHGAGRIMSRRKAVDTLNIEEEKKMLEDKGIIHSITNKDSLEEAPSAYKDIDTVMQEQKDLIKILVKLSPLAVIKGV